MFDTKEIDYAASAKNLMLVHFAPPARYFREEDIIEDEIKDCEETEHINKEEKEDSI